MYIFGIAVVTKNGCRASRLRTFWRSLTPFVLAPILILLLTAFLTAIGLTKIWSLCIMLAFLIAIIAWSLWMPRRGIPDRIAGTYPVPR